MSLKKDLIAEDVSIISHSVIVDGDIFSQGNVRIDGKVTGKVEVSGNLTIGEGSKLNGEIKALNIVLNGDVTGKVMAAEKLRLEPKAVLNGEIYAKSLVIEDGAIFHGTSNMKFAPEPKSH
jgi:cytoskeletal protein CcmA (bactofilin family)